MSALQTAAALALFTTALLAWPVPAAKAQNLRQTQFEDGTGSIGLAPGWQIDSVYRGKVTCVGPNGAAVILGTPWPVGIPGAYSDVRQPMAQVGDLVGALREVLHKRAGARLRSVSGNPAPESFRGVPAFYLLYEFEQNGTAMTGLGYFTTLQYGSNYSMWELYSSAVIAPSDQFPQMLPTMLQMWRTWRPNGEQPGRGSTSHLIDELMRQRHTNRDRISERFRKLL